MTFVNLTPHAIQIVDGPTFPPSGQVARCSVLTVATEVIDGVPVAIRENGSLEGLPDPSEGTIFIVSGVAREAAEAIGRTDCVSPGTLVRDADGVIIGCRDLQRSLT